jgi:hypothetical protein
VIFFCILAEYFTMPQNSKIRCRNSNNSTSRWDKKIKTNGNLTRQEPSEFVMEQCINNDDGHDEAERLESSKVALEKCSNNEDSDGQEVADTSDVVIDVGTKRQRVNIASPKVRKQRSDLGSKRNASGGASQAAIKYGSKYTSELRFMRCGSCMREDSSSKFIELSKVKEAGIINYLRKMKTYNLMQLRRPDSTVYDKIFSNAYQDFVDDDGIFGSSRIGFICLDC